MKEIETLDFLIRFDIYFSLNQLLLLLMFTVRRLFFLHNTARNAHNIIYAMSGGHWKVLEFVFRRIWHLLISVKWIITWIMNVICLCDTFFVLPFSAACEYFWVFLNLLWIEFDVIYESINSNHLARCWSFHEKQEWNLQEKKIKKKYWIEIRQTWMFSWTSFDLLSVIYF